MDTSSRNEKKGVLKAIRDQFRSEKENPETKAFFEAIAEHARKSTRTVPGSVNMEDSQKRIRKAFVAMAKVEFPNIKPEKVFDRMAFFAAHEDEFGKNKRPEVKDYPAENITSRDVEDMNTTYNFSQTYETNGIYKELGSPEKVSGYRTAMMGTGQITGYCAVDKFQKVANAVSAARKQTKDSYESQKAANAFAKLAENVTSTR